MSRKVMARQANGAASHFLQYNETYIPSGNPLKPSNTRGINALSLWCEKHARRPPQKESSNGCVSCFPGIRPIWPNWPHTERGMRGARALCSTTAGYVCGRVYNIIIALGQICRSVSRHFSSEFNRGVGAAALIKCTPSALSPGGRIVIVAPCTTTWYTLRPSAFAAFGAQRNYASPLLTRSEW
jgi:hypothetical protein